MSLCVGCGLTVDDNGLLKVNLCPNGGIDCYEAGEEANCPDGGLAVKMCSDGGLSYDPACTDQNGNPGGIKVTFPTTGDPVFPPNPDPTNPANKPPQLGCGLNTDGSGRITIDFDDTTCDHAGQGGDGAVKNGLRCDDTLGLRFPFQSNIAGNSGVCGGFIERPYKFLLPPNSQTDLNNPVQLTPGTYFWHTDTWLVCPDCDDIQYSWSGNTIWDMGNIKFDVSAGGQVQAVTEISQQYDGGGVVFGATPAQWQIFDNNSAQRQIFSFQSHDSTWQSISGGQCFLFQMRLRVEVVSGNVIVSGVKGDEVWEVNWHYSPNFNLSTGCRAKT